MSVADGGAVRSEIEGVDEKATVKTWSWRRWEPLVAVVLFALALWTLHHTLRDYKYHDLIRHAREIPARRIAIAIGLTACSYLALTGYDALGFFYIRRRLSYIKVALASFVGYAFSHNLGFATVTGSAVRFRLYSFWGLTALEVAKVVALCGITFWLGFLALSGIAFLIQPVPLPSEFHLPFDSVRLLGILFLVVLLAYLIWCGLAKKPLRIHEWEFPPPPLWLSASEIVVSGIDWGMAAGVFFVLLPASHDVSYPLLLSIFLLAQTIGLVSHVPGGLGVFETLAILFLKPMIPMEGIVGALLMYRMIYYLMPFGAAIILLLIHEVSRNRVHFRTVTSYFEGWLSPIVPHLMALTTFGGGAVLLLSGATPAAPERLAWLYPHLPLAVVEIAHLLGSIAGAALLLLARGLQRRIGTAYHLTLTMLMAGAVASLLKGLDYAEAMVLGVMGMALLPCRHHFYRRGSLIAYRSTFGWPAAILIVLGCTVWLGLFSHKHLGYSLDLWRQFSLSGDAARSIRAGFGVVAFVFVFLLARLLRSAPPRPAAPGATDLAFAQECIARSPTTDGQLALLGDKPLLFNDPRTAFLMYGLHGRSWIALGDPVGPVNEGRELVWRFHEICDAHGGWTVFHDVPLESLPMYLDVGLTVDKIGEEARVPLDTFTPEGAGGEELQRVIRSLGNEKLDFAMVEAHGIADHLPELRRTSDSWLSARKLRERRFSTGSFDERYLRRFRTAVIRSGERTLAFACLHESAERSMISADVVRNAEAAPRGVVELLFVKLMQWGREQGFRWFDLGLTPPEGLENHPLAPLWSRIGNLVFRHGELFDDVRAVRRFKSRFSPRWLPRYLVYPGGFILADVLHDLAALISGDGETHGDHRRKG